MRDAASVAVYLYERSAIGSDLAGAPSSSLGHKIMNQVTRHSVTDFLGACDMACGYAFYRPRRRSRSGRTFY